VTEKGPFIASRVVRLIGQSVQLPLCRCRQCRSRGNGHSARRAHSPGDPSYGAELAAVDAALGG
jgi:hypothetical protein